MDIEVDVGAIAGNVIRKINADADGVKVEVLGVGDGSALPVKPEVPPEVLVSEASCVVGHVAELSSAGLVLKRHSEVGAHCELHHRQINLLPDAQSHMRLARYLHLARHHLHRSLQSLPSARSHLRLRARAVVPRHAVNRTEVICPRASVKSSAHLCLLAVPAIPRYPVSQSLAERARVQTLSSHAWHRKYQQYKKSSCCASKGSDAL